MRARSGTMPPINSDDKTELYFNGHDFSHLMLQENYPKTTPAAASNCDDRTRKPKLLELADNAEEIISDGVARMIHGTQHNSKGV